MMATTENVKATPSSRSETRVAELVRERDALAIRWDEAYRRSQDAEETEFVHRDKDLKSQQVFSEAFEEAESAWIELDRELKQVVCAILTAPPQSAIDIAIQASTIKFAMSLDEDSAASARWDLDDLRDEILAFAENAATWTGRVAVQTDGVHHA